MKYKKDKNTRFQEYDLNQEKDIINSDNNRALYEANERKKLGQMQKNLIYNTNKYFILLEYTKKI